MRAPITCAWCDQPATTEVEVEPVGTRVIPTPAGKQSSLRPSRRAPACPDHANPVERTDPPRCNKGPIEGQMDIFDALKGEAA